MNQNIQLPRVTISAAPVVEREGSFTNDAGEKIDYATRKQSAKLESNGFAYPYEVKLEKDQKPYPAGDYWLDVGAMIEVNKKNINLGKFPVLVPVAAASAAK